MKEKLTLLCAYPLGETEQRLLKDIYPQLEIFHTPNCEAMDPLVNDADIIISLNFSDELAKRATKLKWFQAVGAGINHLLTPSFVQRNIVLTNTRGNHTIPVSEHAFALLLALTRRLYRCYGEDNIMSRWQRVYGDELYGKTMGVLGVGNIGREIARKAKAFGMRVRGYDAVPVYIPYLDELYLPYQLEDFFSGVDVLVAAAALTDGSSGIITRDRLSRMNNNSYFINISRGPVVNEEDLVETLKKGPLAGAGLDVFAKEPLPQDSELRSLPNVVLTPHIGGYNPSYEDRVLQVFIENFRRWIQGEPMINVVDTKMELYASEGR